MRRSHSTRSPRRPMRSALQRSRRPLTARRPSSATGPDMGRAASPAGEEVARRAPLSHSVMQGCPGWAQARGAWRGRARLRTRFARSACRIRTPTPTRSPPRGVQVRQRAVASAAPRAASATPPTPRFAQVTLEQPPRVGFPPWTVAGMTLMIRFDRLTPPQAVWLLPACCAPCMRGGGGGGRVSARPLTLVLCQSGSRPYALPAFAWRVRCGAVLRSVGLSRSARRD